MSASRTVRAPYFDLPPGPGLGRRNRRRAAKQENWPAGAVKACEWLERRHPGWYPHYRHAHQAYGGEEPAGYYARNPCHTHMLGWVYAPTVEELGRIIAAESVLAA